MRKAKHFLIRLHPLIYPSFKHYPNSSHVTGQQHQSSWEKPICSPPQNSVVNDQICSLAYLNAGILHTTSPVFICCPSLRVKSEPQFPGLWSLEQQPQSLQPQGIQLKVPFPQTKVSSGFHLIHLTLPQLSAHSHGFYSHLKTTKSHHPAHSRGHWEGSLWFQRILNPGDGTIKLGVNWLCLFPSIFYAQWMILQIKGIFLRLCYSIMDRERHEKGYFQHYRSSSGTWIKCFLLFPSFPTNTQLSTTA